MVPPEQQSSPPSTVLNQDHSSGSRAPSLKIKHEVLPIMWPLLPVSNQLGRKGDKNRLYMFLKIVGL